MTRAEKVAEARRLRDEGLLLREIAERMGVVTQTAHAWLSDPDGARARARKDSYRGTCECGAATHGHAGRGPHAPKRCAACDRKLRRERERERARPLRELVERLWAEGKTSPEIEQVVGWNGHRGAYVRLCRFRGYNLPHRRTPEQIARMTAPLRAYRERCAA